MNWREIHKEMEQAGFNLIILVSDDSECEIRAAFIETNFKGDYFDQHGKLMDHFDSVTWTYGNSLSEMVPTAARECKRVYRRAC